MCRRELRNPRNLAFLPPLFPRSSWAGHCLGRDPLTPVASTQTPPSLLLYTVHIRPIRLHQTGASFFLPPMEREGHRLIPSPPLPPFPLSSPSPFSLTQSQLQFPFARANLGQEMPISSLIPSSSSVRRRLSSYFLLFCAKVFPSSVHLFFVGSKGTSREGLLSS